MKTHKIKIAGGRGNINWQKNEPTRQARKPDDHQRHPKNKELRMKQNIVVWFSCGAASAVAAKIAVNVYGNSEHYNLTVANIPVAEEDDDNIRFKFDVEKWIQYPIITVRNTQLSSDSCEDIWRQERFMSGTKGAICTRLLKKGARYEYEVSNNVDWHILGFCFDEMKRHKQFVEFERSNVLPLLINRRITKQMTLDIIRDNNIELPRMYKLGFPNANCKCCVKATSPTYWNLMRKHFPDEFQKRAALSREIGCRLVRVKGKRKFLDELKETDKGAKMKSWECGIFCNTK